MFLFISTKQLERILAMASKWKTDTDALITTIAAGAPNDQATKDAVTALQGKLAVDEGQESDTAAAVAQLQSDLTETQAVITEMVTKLQEGDAAAAKAVATAAGFTGTTGA